MNMATCFLNYLLKENIPKIKKRSKLFYIYDRTVNI